jgi:hypothetical protein
VKGSAKMKRSIKIINNNDVTNRKKHYIKYQEQLIELGIQGSNYHNKFETGYGWRLTALKLCDYGIISFDFYLELFNWFDTELKQGDKVQLDVWEGYLVNEEKIGNKLINLLSSTGEKKIR